MGHGRPSLHIEPPELLAGQAPSGGFPVAERHIFGGEEGPGREGDLKEGRQRHGTTKQSIFHRKFAITTYYIYIEREIQTVLYLYRFRW